MQNNPAVEALRKLGGVASAGQLLRPTGKSQATISRWINDAGEQIVRLGRGPRTRYAVAEPIFDLPAQMPLYWNSKPWGALTFIMGNQIHVTAPGVELLTQGRLPWFLDNFRLQGFLGRAWALKLGFDPDPEKWSLEQILYANRQHQLDALGAISAGETNPDALISVDAGDTAKLAIYDKYAEDVNGTLPAGSSAGGEQPKFMVLESATGRLSHLIVKFTPPRGTPFGERWHDLLCAESLALKTLSSHGLPAAETRILHSGRRTYLESVRFDRHGFEKKHIAALAVIHREFIREPQRNWAATCDALSAQDRLSQVDAASVRLILEFGRLIGNTDMHFGNLSLYVSDISSARFSLAPCYDMLPMMYRPGAHRDELGYTPVTAVRPGAEHEGAWLRARELAIEFWKNLADAPMVSAGLRAAAAESITRIAAA